MRDQNRLLLKTSAIFISIVIFQAISFAAIDVDMILNDGGFVSFDHFKAELYLNNHDAVVPDAQIFGILEIYGEFYFWPDFDTDVDFREIDIVEGESWLTFLEFDFPDIDDVIPFGPMNFWGAWYADIDNYGYDVEEFWLDADHKWTPTPTETLFPTASPTVTPAPSSTPPSTFTATPIPTPTFTATPIPTPTFTPPPTMTPTLPPPPTFTWTPIPTDTPTELPTNTPTSTFTPDPTDTPTAEPTDTPTEQPTVTPTPTVTQTPGEYEPGDLYSEDIIVGNMRYVPATGPGGFLQGSPEDEPCNGYDEVQFTHILTRNLAVMETEVRRQMWWDLQLLQPDLPDDPTNESYGAGSDNPVQYNTWYESVLFANLLSIENGLTPCYYRDSGYMDVVDATDYINDDHYCNFEADGYRLPTEGEWEYFTRAGTTDPFSCDELNYSDETCGSPYCEPGEFSVLEDYAVYCANDNGESEPVGSKLGNPWNLKDVYGNVWEWCWDWYDVYPSGNEVDYPGAETGSPRVTRGGNWQTAARYCRSAQRNYYWPDNRIYSGGFRLLRATN